MLFTKSIYFIYSLWFNFNKENWIFKFLWDSYKEMGMFIQMPKKLLKISNTNKLIIVDLNINFIRNKSWPFLRTVKDSRNILIVFETKFWNCFSQSQSWICRFHLFFYMSREIFQLNYWTMIFLLRKASC